MGKIDTDLDLSARLAVAIPTTNFKMITSAEVLPRPLPLECCCHLNFCVIVVCYFCCVDLFVRSLVILSLSADSRIS
jgi:hypothetical protein